MAFEIADDDIDGSVYHAFGEHPTLGNRQRASVAHVFLKRTRARRSLFGSPARQLDSLAAHVFTAQA